MKHIVVYIHGKGGSAEETAHYKPLIGLAIGMCISKKTEDVEK